METLPLPRFSLEEREGFHGEFIISETARERLVVRTKCMYEPQMLLQNVATFSFQYFRPGRFVGSGLTVVILFLHCSVVPIGQHKYLLQIISFMYKLWHTFILMCF